MNVYWYCPFENPDVPTLASELARAGDRVTAHLPRAASPFQAGIAGPDYRELRDLPAVLSWEKGRIRWLSSRAAAYLRRAHLRGRMVRSSRYDVCHLFHLNRFTDGWALRFGRRVPLISNVHDVMPHDRRGSDRLERRLLASLYRNAGTLVVAHDRLRRQLAEEFDVPDERIEVIPLPIHAPRDATGPVKGPQSPTVLFFGSLRRNKGIPTLLHSAELLNGNGDVRFHVAGGGPPDMEELVRDAGSRHLSISAEIGFVPLERKDPLFRSACLVVLPYESFTSQSAVLGDAYSYGVPVVVTDVGALGDTVREDRTGWVVPPSDPKALAEAITSALADEPARRLAAEHARRAATARSYEVVGQALHDLYRRLAA